MKNTVFISALLLSSALVFKAHAQAAISGSCAPDNDTTSTCRWELKPLYDTQGNPIYTYESNYTVQAKELVFSGTGAMKDYEYSTANNRWPDVRKVSIGDDITNIGNNAFRNMSKVKLFVIGDSVSSFGSGTFLSTYGAKLVNEDSPLVSRNGFYPALYSKNEENGVYFLISQGYVNTTKQNQKYYASLEEMTNISTNETWLPTNYCTQAQYDTCKDRAKEYQQAQAIAQEQQALNNKAQALLDDGKFCHDIDECRSLVVADANGEILTVGKRSYSSLEDLLNGNHLKKRIYTIDEANAVTGETNSFKIKYR